MHVEYGQEDSHRKNLGNRKLKPNGHYGSFCPTSCDDFDDFDDYEELPTICEGRPSASSPPSFSDEAPCEGAAVKTDSRNVCPPTCLVCGAPATGYHYDAASCNGCKAFFRRTILSGKRLACRFDDNCFDVSQEERRKCRACRYNKCISIGMNPKAMQAAKTDCCRSLLGKSLRFDESSPCSSKETSDSMEAEARTIVDELLMVELKAEAFRKNFVDLEEHLSLEKLLGSASRLLGAAKVEPQDWQDECASTSAADSNANMRRWLLVDLLTTVEYAKTFPFFQKIDLHDKILLMKSVALMIHNLTNAFFAYEHNDDVVVRPDGTILGCPFLRDTKEAQVYTKMQKRSIEPLQRLGVTKSEYVLLKAISFCNSAVAGLSRRTEELLVHERQKFAAVLLSHCLTSQGDEQGPAQFTSVLAIVDVLEHEQRNEKDLYVMCSLSRSKSTSSLIDDIFL